MLQFMVYNIPDGYICMYSNPFKKSKSIIDLFVAIVVSIYRFLN